MTIAPDNKKPKRRITLRHVLKIIMILMALFFFGFIFYQQWYGGLNPRLFDQIVDHYAVFLTIPCAGFAALLLVVIFDQAYGNIKFSIWEIKFEGAAAPLILWIFCFLSIIFAVKMLW